MNRSWVNRCRGVRKEVFVKVSRYTCVVRLEEVEFRADVIKTSLGAQWGSYYREGWGARRGRREC